MSSEYWQIVTSEILGDHGVEVDLETMPLLAAAFESAASVQGEYEAPVSGNDEVAELKNKIKMLEDRRPCTTCSGDGTERRQVTNSHVSLSSCYKCNGNGWV